MKKMYKGELWMDKNDKQVDSFNGDSDWLYI